MVLSHHHKILIHFYHLSYGHKFTFPGFGLVLDDFMCALDHCTLWISTIYVNLHTIIVVIICCLGGRGQPHHWGIHWAREGDCESRGQESRPNPSAKEQSDAPPWWENQTTRGKCRGSGWADVSIIVQYTVNTVYNVCISNAHDRSAKQGNYTLM